MVSDLIRAVVPDSPRDGSRVGTRFHSRPLVTLLQPRTSKKPTASARDYQRAARFRG
jgi:hypothetical protein